MVLNPMALSGKSMSQPQMMALIDAAPDLLAVLQELQECASYSSDYDVPLGLADRINNAAARATRHAPAHCTALPPTLYTEPEAA